MIATSYILYFFLGFSAERDGRVFYWKKVGISMNKCNVQHIHAQFGHIMFAVYCSENKCTSEMFTKAIGLLSHIDS